MNIVSERVTVVANMTKSELTILMQGFRIVLTGDECRAVGNALAEGMKRLYPELSCVRVPSTVGISPGKASEGVARENSATQRNTLTTVGRWAEPAR